MQIFNTMQLGLTLSMCQYSICCSETPIKDGSSSLINGKQTVDAISDRVNSGKWTTLFFTNVSTSPLNPLQKSIP